MTSHSSFSASDLRVLLDAYYAGSLSGPAFLALAGAISHEWGELARARLSLPAEEIVPEVPEGEEPLYTIVTDEGWRRAMIEMEMRAPPEPPPETEEERLIREARKILASLTG